MSQPLIKLMLLAALTVVGYYAVRGSRRAIHRVVWRGFVVLALISGVFAVIFPNTLTRVAQQVGVGRGADLLLYLLVVAFMLVSVVLFRRLNDLERKYVRLAREFAVREASDRSGEEETTSHRPNSEQSE